MSRIFNTPFEVSLRILLTLEASSRQWLSADWIAASDFITVYCSDFGISGENLHGDNNYKYSEFALRREIVKEASKMLVSRRLIDVKTVPDGFVFALSKSGGDYCSAIESEYAQSYRDLAVAVREHIGGKTEREVLSLINQHAISSLRRSGYDG